MSATTPATGGATELPSEPNALLAHAVLTDEGRQDPYPAYDLLRSTAPVFDSAMGSIVLSRYEDCLEVLRHPGLGRPEADMDVPPALSGRDRRPGSTSTMLLLNPPDHTRIRSLVSRVFTPRRVEALRPRLAELLGPVLDRFSAEGGGDVIAEIAIPFPVTVISELLGVPTEGNEHLRPLVHDTTAFIDAAADEERLARAEVAVAEIATYFVELIEEKRRDPDEHLLSALIEVEEQGDRLSPEELVANTILLYAAGFETTSNLIGNGLRLLLTHPDQMERLRHDRALMGPAVWEMLRYDSPVQLNGRTALAPVRVLGRSLERGDSFLVLQGAGNRDPEAYPHADAFDVTRFTDPGAATPLSFGWGPHHCLGAHLARAEGEVVFGALLDRFATMELDSDALGGGPPHFRESFTLRGLDSLPVRVG